MITGVTAISFSTPVTVVVPGSRIAIAIMKWVPTDVVAKRKIDYECDERRTPPTAFAVKLATRRPGPVTVVVNPATEMIRRPSPRFIADPSPAVGRNPDPLAVTIWRPVRITADDFSVWPPDPAVVVGPGPYAIVIEVFRAPNVVIVMALVLS